MNPCYSETGSGILFQEAGASYGAPLWRYEDRVAWLLSNIEFKESMTVLDLGCHDGFMLSLLPKHVKKIGADIDHNILKKAKKKCPDITFICGDIERLSFSSDIDLITIFHVLEHVRKPTLLLRNLLKFVNDETILAVEVPVLEHGNCHDINSFFSVHHLTHFTIRSITHCLTTAGWKTIRCKKVKEKGGYRLLARPGSTKVIDWMTNYDDDRCLLYEYLSNFYKCLQKTAKKMTGWEIDKFCVIWGAGSHTELLYKLTPFFRLSSMTRYIIVDNDSNKWGKTWRGINIYSPRVLDQIDWTKTNLIISSYGSQESIAKEAMERGIEEDRIIKLY